MNISLISCSRNSTLPQSLIKNIEDTIFSPADDKKYGYEIITIDNSNNHYNIFQAYNEGVRRSSGEILCFMHDDLEYESVGWGNNVINLFNKYTEAGACAVVCCTYIKSTPSYYYSDPAFNMMHVQLQNSDGTRSFFYDYLDVDHPCPVVVFDGLWFCIRRECFNRISFDERTYNGFHMYDLDISMQLNLAGYKIFNIPGVEIFHIAGQATDKRFWEAAFKFYHKFKNHLPRFSEGTNVSNDKRQQIEKKALYSALHNIIRQRIFCLLWKWFSVASEVLGKNKIEATYEVLRFHFTRSN